MRCIVLSTVIAAALSSYGWGKPQGGGVEQTIMRIEQEMLAAALKGDASAAERYMADAYVFTGPDGSVEGKAQSVADLKSGDLKLESASLDEAKVNVHGDTAIVTYSSNDKGTYKGKDISGKTRWTDVFVRRNGRWQLVATHGSRIAQQ
jgi:ketosteroid isomerase-like protein